MSLVDLGPGQLGPGQLGPGKWDQPWPTWTWPWPKWARSTTAPAMANLDVAMAKPGHEHPGLAVAAGRSCLAFSPPCHAAEVRFSPLLSRQGHRVRAGTLQNESQQKQRENSWWDNLPAQATLALLQLQLQDEPLLFVTKALFHFFPPKHEAGRPSRAPYCPAGCYVG